MKRDFTDARYSSLTKVNKQVLDNDMWHNFASRYSHLGSTTRSLASKLGYSSTLSTLKKFTDFGSAETSKCNKAVKATFSTENDIDQRYAQTVRRIMDSLTTANTAMKQLATGVTPGGITVSADFDGTMTRLTDSIRLTNAALGSYLRESDFIVAASGDAMGIDNSTGPDSMRLASSEEVDALNAKYHPGSVFAESKINQLIAALLKRVKDDDPLKEFSFVVGGMVVTYKMDADASIKSSASSVLKAYNELKSCMDGKFSYGDFTLESAGNLSMKIWERKSNDFTGTVTVKGTPSTASMTYKVNKNFNENGVSGNASMQIKVETIPSVANSKAMAIADGAVSQAKVVMPIVEAYVRPRVEEQVEEFQKKLPIIIGVGCVLGIAGLAVGTVASAGTLSEVTLPGIVGLSTVFVNTAPAFAAAF